MATADNTTPGFASAHILGSRQEVLDMLKLVAAKHARVIVTFVESKTELTSNIADINLHFDEIILAGEPATTSALVALPKLAPELLTILTDKNKFQFHIDHIEHTVFKGEPALRIRFPKLVFCSERRGRVRVSPPLDQSLACLVRTNDLEQNAELDLPVIDISIGGLSVMAHPLNLQVHIGKELRDCRLALPDIGEIFFSLIIRSITEGSHAGDGRRCGCEFLEIKEEMLVRVQRYVDLHRVGN